MNPKTKTDNSQTELEKFKKDFDKLMSKYPNIRVGGDMNGDPFAYHLIYSGRTSTIKLH